MKNSYKSLGFVEALIAIAVAGIASIVLMGIAANTILQVIKNEVSDTLTEKSIKGANLIKNIANEHNNSDDVLFPSINGNIGRCFAFSDTEPSAFTITDGVFTESCNYDGGEREQCQNYTLEDGEYFRVFCITSESDSASGMVVGKIITGLADCEEGNDSSKCGVSDYEYYSIFKVIQK